MDGAFDKNWWRYDQLPSGHPYDWSPTNRGDSPFDNIDFHVDLGCGRLKKGRLGIDHHPDPGVDIPMDLETLRVASAHMPWDRWMGLDPLWAVNEDMQLLAKQETLPFPDASIESIISHHCLEHIGPGFLRLMDECYRVLVPGGIFRIIVPLFPSRTAVEDPDHKRYFMAGTFETFCGTASGGHWHESFSTPYTNCRFEKVDQDITPPVDPEDQWGDDDAREIRVALRKWDA